jgi:outer membrane protein assembly factor BamD (BamD/ComL family)/TM2 domain-containing membrane protein YozV
MRHFFATIMAFLFLASPCFCQGSAGGQGIYITEEVQLRLGDVFFSEGEYYRAITEYRKFAILFPASDKGAYALFRTGLASYLGEEYADAARIFSLLRRDYPGSEFRDPAMFFEAIARWRKKDYQEAELLFDQLAKGESASGFAPRASAAKALLELDMDDVKGARAELERFLALFPGHAGEPDVREALALFDEYEHLPRKSEILAGILSAILPGSGYVYAGRYGDGLTAFLLNGLFIAGTVMAVQSQWYPAAGLTGGIGLPFYLGNIYGSANAAARWNASVKKEARAGIARRLEPIIDSKGVPAPVYGGGSAALISAGSHVVH